MIDASAVAAKGYAILKARALTALRGKKKPPEALKAGAIAYLRFAAENPALYRLMFGPILQGPDGRLPSEIISEDGTLKIPRNDPAALETAVIAIWSLNHGLTMLYIDGLATLETAQTIDDLAEKVVGIFTYGLVKREK